MLRKFTKLLLLLMLLAFSSGCSISRSEKKDTIFAKYDHVYLKPINYENVAMDNLDNEDVQLFNNNKAAFSKIFNYSFIEWAKRENFFSEIANIINDKTLIVEPNLKYVEKGKPMLTPSIIIMQTILYDGATKNRIASYNTKRLTGFTSIESMAKLFEEIGEDAGSEMFLLKNKVYENIKAIQ